MTGGLIASARWRIVAATLGLRDDTGDVAYAQAAGVYQPGCEVVPVDPVARPSLDAGTAVLFTFGQSNAANAGGAHDRAGDGVRALNIFDSHFYAAPARTPV